MADDNLDARLAAEVTQLSTKLVTEVAKSLQLEEIILQLRRELAAHKSDASKAKRLESENASISGENSLLAEQVATLTKEKAQAEEKNKQLEGEVEDLTASLFNEANEMVSNASRETYNFKMKNRKLIEELAEKDTIIESLQEQLKDLKDMFMRLEDQRKSSRMGTPRMEHDFESADLVAGSELEDENPLWLQLLYGPRARAIRFDVSVYQEEFKSFIYQLILPDFQFDLASLKNLKYFRRIWTDEIEPCVAHIPPVSGNFMNRWSKGKTFWGLLVEGRAIIEPVSGVNETFKLTYKGAKTGDEIPVAIKDPCVFCGECKDDMLEHARLYNLKLYGPASETGGSGKTREIAGEAHEVIGTHPLCNFCLVKLRSICDFFAKLRMIHANIYKLKQNLNYDDIAFVSNFQFKKAVDAPQHVLDPDDEPVVLKLYLMLLVIRAKIFWSKIGIWDTDDGVEVVSLDEINIDVFRQVVRDNVAFQHLRVQPQGAVPLAVTTTAEYEKENGITSEEKTVKEDDEEKDDAEKEEEEEEEKEDEGDILDQYEDEDVNESSRDDSDDDEFADTTDNLEEAHQPAKKGKSKAFKEKIDKDLDLTMDMLKESIDSEKSP